MRKLILFLVLGMFLISFASASSIIPHKQDEDLKFSMTSNEAVSCTLTTINTPTNVIIINQSGTKTSQTFNFTVLKENLTTMGVHQFNIECVDGDSNVVSGYIEREITLNGKQPAEGIIVVIFIIIFIGIFFFGLFSFFQALEQVIQFKMNLYDTIKLMGSYFAMWIFYYFSLEYLGNIFINDILEIAISFGWITHIFLALVGLMVSYIMTNLKFKQKARITY